VLMLSEFILGGSAAACAISVMHPIDVLKTRLQMQGEAASHSSSNSYRGIVSSLIQIFKLEGLRGLYRGLPAAWLLQISVNGTRIGLYQLCKPLFPQDTFFRNFMLAIFAGMCGAFVGNPFYLLKSQYQIISGVKQLQVGHQHTHINLFSSFIGIISKHGIKGLWHGVDAYIARVVAFSSAQLSSYDYVKSVLFSRKDLQYSTWMIHLMASFCAAVAASIVMQPFDMVTSRMMNQPVKNGKGQFYSGPLDCFIKVVKTEGWTALGRGGMANVMRVGPYTVLFFMFYEQYKSLWKQHFGNK